MKDVIYPRIRQSNLSGGRGRNRASVLEELPEMETVEPACVDCSFKELGGRRKVSDSQLKAAQELSGAI